jgi:tetratricopeptide (TPR) repeat protein
MKHTFFTAPPRLKLKTAEGYAETRQPAGPWDFPLAGGGGLRSDINDMLTFAEANLGFTDAAILPALELTHVKQAIKDGNDSYVTMGWTLWNEEGRHLVFKDGGTGGYRSFLGVDKKDKIAVVVLSNTNNGVTDIGLHILEPNHNIEPYKYPWALLDTLRSTVQARGADEAIALYKQLKAANNKSFTFNEQQLNHLGTELRRSKKIKAAIKIFKLNAAEYPKSALVYESLAETHKRNKNKKTAIGYFEKAKELDPNNPHWTYMLDKLKG